jgi:hypothetical protein
MAMTDDEIILLLHRTIDTIRMDSAWSEGELAEKFLDIADKYDFFKFVYRPSQLLMAIVAEYEQWYKGLESARKTKNQLQVNALTDRAGKLMEELVYLAFDCLEGKDTIKSFQSYSAQHDLIISGSKPSWSTLIEKLHLPGTSRTLVIEAKNTEVPVSDQQFSRLCSIMQNKLQTTCSLGIFFSRSGATGFPNRDDGRRQRALQDSRATQVLFHARTDKFVVVIDHDDILQLDQIGSLPRLLEARIKDVEEASGLSLDLDLDWNEVDLPSHLSKYSEAASE